MLSGLIFYLVFDLFFYSANTALAVGFSIPQHFTGQGKDMK
jgi:hypothetical protein